MTAISTCSVVVFSRWYSVYVDSYCKDSGTLFVSFKSRLRRSFLASANRIAIALPILSITARAAALFGVHAFYCFDTPLALVFRSVAVVAVIIVL